MSEEKALVPIEQKQVEFYGDELTAVLAEDGMVYVPLRPICNSLGLDWDGQRQRIHRDPVLSEIAMSAVITTADIEPGSRRPRSSTMLCLPLDFLNGWLFGVNANRVNSQIRNRLISYQRECYRVLARAFQQPAETAVSPASTLYQVREMGRAIMQMADEQIEFEQRLSKTEGRLDRAAVIVGDIDKRLAAVENKVTPGTAVTESQAMQISQAVKAVALEIGKQTNRNEYGAVYGEMYRKFAITGYKMLPASRFQECVAWLTEWHQQLTGDAPL
jgi:hypothetical protein